VTSSDFQPAAAFISNLAPLVEGGRYPAKAIEGDQVRVSADVFRDGHDLLSAAVQWRKYGAGDLAWEELPLAAGDNDRWSGSFPIGPMGRWEYRIVAWPDRFRTWRHAFEAKHEAADPELALVLEEGALLFEAAAKRASSAKAKGKAKAKAKGDVAKLTAWARTLRHSPVAESVVLLRSAELEAIVDQWADRTLLTCSAACPLHVERPLARFSAWYEFFPRSAVGDGVTHGTFRDCGPRLDDAKEMGFDIVYLPPIHPIGVTNRKGRNNATDCEPDDFGSPWAIGGPAGGHYDVEPELGTIADFEWFVKEAGKRGLEVALDFALNCSPDHPFVKEHPDWFHHRPDGSIMYAENPPKKYQDIYPLDFHCEDRENLWNELVAIVRFWMGKGVRVFRVDNPHTKPVTFWEYLIGGIHATDPDVVFLAEAFTRPRMMQALGKVGFSQSYTYFTWRESKEEIIDYLHELTQGEMRDFYRANFWPNTPDILPGHLQNAPLSVFKIRAALAATLSSSWGMYSGYEFGENKPLPGKEEYLDSEKYQLAERDWTAPGIRSFLARLNVVRRENPALHLYDNLRFHEAGNPQLICYSKTTADLSNVIVIVVSLDGFRRQEGTVQLPLEDLGIDPSQAFDAVDLVHGNTYQWQGHDNFVSLDPVGRLLHVFRLEQKPKGAKAAKAAKAVKAVKAAKGAKGAKGDEA